MRICWGLRLGSLLVVFAGGSAVSAETQANEDVLKAVLSARIKQDPPEWKTPETDLSSDFVKVAEAVFNLGLGDPRGGEYRDVTITVWSTNYGRDNLTGATTVASEAKQVEAMGWVFPKTDVHPAYVVCWDGLLYRPYKVGAKRDLFDDISKEEPSGMDRFAITEPYLKTDGLIANALLFRLGVIGSSSFDKRVPRNSAFYERGQMLDEYASSLYLRGVRAFVAGDDESAYRDLYTVSELRSSEQVRLSAKAGGYSVALPFLNDVEDLRDDVGNRLKFLRKVETEWSEIRELEPYERTYSLLTKIAILKGDTLNLTTYSPGQNHEPEDFDAILSEPMPAQDDWRAQQQYIRALEAAIFNSPGCSVELVAKVGRERDHYLRDARLPVRFSLRWGYVEKERKFTRLGKVAQGLLEKRFGHPVASDLTESEDRIDQLVAYWQRYREHNVPERHIQILQDNDRPISAWSEAALVLQTELFQREDEEAAKVHAQFVEEHREEIAAVIEKRFEEITSDSKNFKEANRLTTLMAAINPQASLPMIKKTLQMTALDENWASGATYKMQRFVFYGLCAGVTTALRLGDFSVASSYVDLVAKVSSKGFRGRETAPGPVILFPDIAEFKPLIQSAFDLTLGEHKLSGRSIMNTQLEDYLNAQFLRPSLRRLLENETVIGKGSLATEYEQRVTEIQSGEVKSTALSWPHFDYTLGELHAQSPVKLNSEDDSFIGLMREMRVCDVIADKISKAGFGPEFRYYWPIDRRDRAISKIKEALLTDTFVPAPTYNPNYEQWWYRSSPIRSSD